MLLQKNWSMGMFMGRVGITIKDSKNRRSEGEGSKGEKRKEGLGKDKKEEHRTQNPELRTLNSEHRTQNTELFTDSPSYLHLPVN